METYDRKGFARQLLMRGLMNDKDEIREYISKHRKETYTEADLEQAYHDRENAFVSKRKWWLKEAPSVMVWDENFKEEVITNDI